MSNTPSPPLPDDFLMKKSKKKNLVICESPAKIKKIQSFLGDQFIVMASFGHIRDLDPKNISVDLENGFTPNYIVSSGKEKVVRELKSQMKNCDKLWLASDFDREGESIGWHVQNVLKVPTSKTKRIIFKEITKKAILKAVKNPTTLDINMFYSQQARRILDRVIGYLISPQLEDWPSSKSAGAPPCEIQELSGKYSPGAGELALQIEMSSTWRASVSPSVGTAGRQFSQCP